MKPLKTQIYPAYGIASLGKVAVEVMLQLYLFDFYTRVLGLSPLLAGSAFAVAIIWDAISDIAVSAALFKTREKGIYYSSVMSLGAIVLALATILLFSPPGESSQFALFLHLLIAYVLVNTGMTLVDLPQSSLSAELSHQAQERNKLLASRMGFGIAGLCLGSILPGLFLLGQSLESETESLAGSRELSAWTLAATVIITVLLGIPFLRRREKETQQTAQPKVPTRKEAIGIFQDKGFLKITLAGVVAAVGRTVNAALALMYYRFVLDLSEKQVTQIIFPAFTLSIIFSIPLWIWLSREYGKKRPAYMAIVSLGIMGILAYPILPPGQILPPILISILGGIFCGAVFLIDSIITDLIDADADKTNKRKEALYFAVWKSALKIARAAAFVIIGLGLQLVELDLSLETVSKSMQWAIIGLFGIVVGVCFVVSGLLIKSADVPAPRED